MTKVVRSMLSQNMSSSDPSSVLNAGWQAMQITHPELASAVMRLPPQLQQQAVLQYTNAVRLGREADAGKMATDAVRSGLAEMSKQAPAEQGGRKIFAGVEPAKNTGINDVASFDAAIAPPPKPENTRQIFAGISGDQNAASQSASAYNSVKDSYNNFNSQQGSNEYLWTKPSDRPLNVPANWTPQNDIDLPSTPYTGPGPA